MRSGHRKIPYSDVSHIDCYSMDFVSGLREGNDDDRKFHDAKNKIVMQMNDKNIDKRDNANALPSQEQMMHIEISFRCDKQACKFCCLSIIQCQMEVTLFILA